MRRTSWINLVSLGGLGVVLGWSLQLWLVGAGYPALLLQLPYSLVLVGLAVVLLLAAWPIRRQQKDSKAKKVDPFVAFRVAVLAKASSHAGALLTGFAAGIFIWVLAQTVLPTNFYWLTGAAALAGAILLIAGLIAESFCALPPDDEIDATVVGE